MRDLIGISKSIGARDRTFRGPFFQNAHSKKGKKPMSLWEMIAAAFVLDFICGDPRWLPHPIRWMGKSILALEASFRNLPLNRICSGALLASLLIGGTWGLSKGLLILAGGFHPFGADILETLLIYYSISARSLADAGMAIFRPLRQNRLAEARKKAAMIVGRDVHALDTEKLSRAGVESVAENLVDGVVSPLFYAALGGAPLAMAFKMVNTLDSMIGYKNERYGLFGRAAAKIDDAANFIPARLSMPIIALAAHLLAKKGRTALKTAMLEGNRHASPNSGYPEAAFAGVLGITLGGPGVYQGIRVEKPEIGIGLGKAKPFHIRRACDLMLLSAALWTFLAMVVASFWTM